MRWLALGRVATSCSDSQLRAIAIREVGVAMHLVVWQFRFENFDFRD